MIVWANKDECGLIFSSIPILRASIYNSHSNVSQARLTAIVIIQICDSAKIIFIGDEMSWSQVSFEKFWLNYDNGATT